MISEVTPSPQMPGETDEYTSSHRSTSTGTTIVIDRTQHFRSTPIPTTQLHTQTSIFYNTQSSIFSRFHEHTSTPVITWSTIHASTPMGNTIKCKKKKKFFTFNVNLKSNISYEHLNRQLSTTFMASDYMMCFLVILI